MRYFACLCILLPLLAWSQNPAQKTYCNPMDINYRYNFEQLNENISYRAAADPVIVNHKGEYFLFATISGGWWHSKDLVNWRYVIPDKWPMEDMCAPAAMSVRDTLYLFQSTFDRRPIFYTTTPENGKLHFYNRWLPQLPKEVGPWDPALFYDEELDKWYMYWGSSNVYPLYGSELDKSKRLKYKGEYKGLIYLRPEEHGWERFGRDHTSSIKPFTEGAWMTKHNGKYYLQYGAPGTEYNVYANGTYVGDHPLGPFSYAPYNPVSYKPGGFVTGAGHGNTFQDNYGNYWNTGTPWIAVNWNFERRIAIFPAGFDQEGHMFANSRFGDFPQFLPTKKWENKDELFTGWMLLSYKKAATSSPALDTFNVARVTDENPRTFWVSKENKEGAWIILDLEKICEVRALQVNFTDFKSDIVADKDVRPSDLESCNLILFGTKETNLLIDKYKDRLPLHLTASTSDHGLFYVVPVDGHYVALSSGLPWWTGNQEQNYRFPASFVGVPELKDYILFKGTLKNVIADGYFDENWKLAEQESKKIAASGAAGMK